MPATYLHAHDHLPSHRAVGGCPYCGMTAKERRKVHQMLLPLLEIHAPWIQYQPRTSSAVAALLLPNACFHARESWLLQEIGDALWELGYRPDQADSPDPVWTWRGDFGDEDEVEVSW
jgi:hypothetical protein